MRRGRQRKSRMMRNVIEKIARSLKNSSTPCAFRHARTSSDAWFCGLCRWAKADSRKQQRHCDQECQCRRYSGKSEAILFELLLGNVVVFPPLDDVVEDRR